MATQRIDGGLEWTSAKDEAVAFYRKEQEACRGNAWASYGLMLAQAFTPSTAVTIKGGIEVENWYFSDETAEMGWGSLDACVSFLEARGHVVRVAAVKGEPVWHSAHLSVAVGEEG